MLFSAQQINELLNGQIEGDPTVEVSTIAKIEEAQAGELCFLANMKYESFAYTTQASILLVNADFEPKKPIHSTLIRVPDAYAAFSKLMNFYQAQLQAQQQQQQTGIHETACIANEVSLGEEVTIGALCYIAKGVRIGANSLLYPQVYTGENVSIGENCIIYPGVKIMHDCIIGNNCTIHAGTIIGSDGFGFAPQADGSYAKIPQLGNVILEDGVEIGANVCVDRATMGSTIIREGVKLDNLIQVGHNVEIGKQTVMAALSGISGSTKIGANCMIGGQVGFSGHIEIADKVKVSAQSGVTKSFKKEEVVLSGAPATYHRDDFRTIVMQRRLPDIMQRMKNLEKEIAELKKR